MGLQACAARVLAVSDVTTVVVTSTITGLASDSWFGFAKGQPWARRLGAVICISVGAFVGSLLLRHSLAVGVGASAFVTLAVAGIGHFRISGASDVVLATSQP
jgi:hypothetical protein